jgi:hypothetical protein
MLGPSQAEHKHDLAQVRHRKDDGPLIKSSDQTQPEPTHDELSQGKTEESDEV